MLHYSTFSYGNILQNVSKLSTARTGVTFHIKLTLHRKVVYKVWLPE